MGLLVESLLSICRSPEPHELDIVVYTCSISTWKAETGGSEEVQDQSWIHTKFKTGLRSLSLCHKTKQPE